MTDIETRLTDALAELAELIPDQPPSSFQEVRAWRDAAPTITAAEEDFWQRGASTRRWRRPRSLTAIIALGALALGGIGTGIAAAAGVFSPGPAVQREFKQLTQHEAHAPSGSQPAPVISKPTPATEHYLVRDPGPEGTTITVWASSPTPGVNCFVAQVSEAGQKTFPGKPATPESGGCGGAPNANSSASSTLLTGGGAGIWRSSSGTLYMIMSSATVPHTARVVITFADGTAITPGVGNGWFALGVPYNEWAAGFTQVEYSSSGAVLYKFNQPPAESH